MDLEGKVNRNGEQHFLEEIYTFLVLDLDSVIQDEAEELIQTFIEESSATGEVKIHTIFSAPVINVLWQIVGSKRFDPKAPSTKVRHKS